MDFFEQQHRARRNTGWILLAFVLAVAAIVLSINVVGGFIYLVATERPLFPAGVALSAVPRSAYVITTVVVLGVILCGTLVRVHELSGGGVAVAGMVGARRVPRNTGVLEEKRLLNVVEEMALASGIAVPQVFVMDGHGSINAFAAGYSPNEAAIVVTEGALKRLTRDEIQGVIGHEFSHILNGDMRLNVQLLGLIAGIVLIGAAGRFLVGGRAFGDDDDSRSVRSTRDARLLLVGLVLWLIGSVGVFAAQLIKAAVSREREFLADASAVQFTRNPDGIAGALFKIDERGGYLFDRHAEEISHMCVSAPLGDFFDFPWLRTHPPLEERMERLLGPVAKRRLAERNARTEAAALAAGGGPVVQELSSPLYTRSAGAAATAAALISSIGSPSPAHVVHARRLLETIPAEVGAAAANSAGARAVVFALLLDTGEVRERQLALLREETDAALAAQCGRLADALAPLGPRMRLPVLSLALPALKSLEQDARDRLLQVVRGLVEVDAKVSLGEFVLMTVLRRYLGKPSKGGTQYRDIASLAPEVAIVLSLIARAGGGGMFEFGKGMEALGLEGGLLQSLKELRFDVVDSALGKLKLLAPLKKPAFIKACVAVAMADDKLTVVEGELLRVICAVLDSPLPPILETSEGLA